MRVRTGTATVEPVTDTRVTIMAVMVAPPAADLLVAKPAVQLAAMEDTVSSKIENLIFFPLWTRQKILTYSDLPP